MGVVATLLLIVVLAFASRDYQLEETRNLAAANIIPLPMSVTAKKEPLKANDLTISQVGVHQAGGIIKLTMPIPDGRGGEIIINRFLKLSEARDLAERLTNLTALKSE